MIVYESTRYRIERYDTPLRYALDEKKPNNRGGVDLINIGWYNSYFKAVEAMAESVINKESLADESLF